MRRQSTYLLTLHTQIKTNKKNLIPMRKIISKPTLLDALVPVFVLVLMLGGLVYVFG